MENISINSSNHNGLQLHLCNTLKFKTVSITLTMKIPLHRELTTARALIPYILISGSRNYSSRRLIKQKLDEMYGATLTPDVYKKGDSHIISLNIEIPADQYINTSYSLIEKSLSLLHEIVYNPALENGVFQSSIVEQEKRSLEQRINSNYNEKMHYSNNRLIEEMFKGEQYELPAAGRKEDIDDLNAISIYQVYEDLLQNAVFSLFIIGSFNEENVKFIVQDIFCEQFHKNYNIIIPEDRKVRKKVKVIQDKMDVKHGNLLLGYRTFATIQDKDYESTRVANAIFGRFPFSKLFTQLREKESLAYFAFSQIESNKGLMIAMAGIDFGNYERAVNLIREQEYAMKKGDFTEDEVEQAKAMLIHLFLEAYDTPLGIMDLTVQAIDSGLSNINNQIKRISKISKNDVIRAVNKWELDTIYFLSGKEDDKSEINPF
ncbi:insulinase family protein [Ornithinibacillus massiliensis]|uniref:Insulinase family protein n=1 Tax=Ornithinibacillus massiliensis TaxID=1944633 RepID=A0ABS5M8X4_9BACI|nr:pitrilysin family protein [Ornithinibacillus massiliensis]MBS3678758.1 insulinase family protein [Ornithinibacillus massiliensis]